MSMIHVRFVAFRTASNDLAGQVYVCSTPIAHVVATSSANDVITTTPLLNPSTTMAASTRIAIQGTLCLTFTIRLLSI